MNLTSSEPSADIPEEALESMREILADRLLIDPAECLSYGYDNSRQISMPKAVAFALSDMEIQSLIKICRKHGIAVTARGRGTNTTGASVPLAGGLVISLERMNRILKLSAGDRMIECEAGALNGDIQRAAAEHGLFWAPDPTSADFSTVGGNLACGAGGPRAVKYGTVRDNVLGLSAVTGSGELIRAGCHTTKGVVGYDLTRLMIGSEGTLAIVTTATLKLLPKPSQLRTMRASYRCAADAIEAVTRIMGQPATPCALEFFDSGAVRLAQAWRDCGLAADAGAMLLIDIDGEEPGLSGDVEAVIRAATVAGMLEIKTASTAEERADLWAARKALSPSLRKLAPRKVNEDVVVPVTRLPELLSEIEILSKQHGIQIVCFGHAGNGNIHVNLLADPSDPAQQKGIEDCLQALFPLVLKLDGTLSGEHGVGIAKRQFVEQEIAPASLALMQQIKQVFDPDGIMNPGKTLPSPTE